MAVPVEVAPDKVVKQIRGKLDRRRLQRLGLGWGDVEFLAESVGPVARTKRELRPMLYVVTVRIAIALYGVFSPAALPERFQVMPVFLVNVYDQVGLVCLNTSVRSDEPCPVAGLSVVAGKELSIEQILAGSFTHLYASLFEPKLDDARRGPDMAGNTRCRPAFFVKAGRRR